MRRKLAWPLLVAALGLVLASGIYIANPLGTASRDLGARLWGRATMRVPDKAMEPTLLAGYELEVDTSAFRRQPPRRGDLLVYFSADGPRIGRVVALPGERVAMRLGDVFVDEVLQAAPEGVQVPTGPGPGRDLAETRVPPGQVFVLADNRDLGGDSRDTGPVPARRWVGKVVAVRR
ncbi:signal peptidase I [Arenimonas sp.]|uniref:signal peptidase I n=1 Tax=Arenimonas sp. TaxID=1872635 RepID=UPI0035B201EF